MPSCARARWKHISFHCDIIFGYWTIILLKSKQNNFNKGIEVHRKLWMSKFHCNLLSPWIVFSRGLASTSHTFFDLYFDLKFWQESSFRCSLQVYDLDHTHLLASFKQSGTFDQRTLLVDFWVKNKNKNKNKKKNTQKNGPPDADQSFSTAMQLQQPPSTATRLPLSHPFC